MQITLKLSRAQKHTKLTLHTKFQSRMIFSLLFIGASDLPVFARTVLYPLCNLEVVGDGYGVTRGGCAKKGMELKSPMKNKLKFRMKVYKLNEHCLES